jgi:hypothetical protein
MYADSSDDEELVSWWRDAARLRLRSRSETLVGARFCPTLDDLVAGGVRGAAVAFSTYRLRPEKRARFFSALEDAARAEELRGRRLVGAYEVAFTNDRARAIWAHATLRDLAEFEATRPAGPVAAADAVVEWTEHWGFAVPGTPLAAAENGAKVW